MTKGSKMAKKPRMWRMRIIPSSLGSQLLMKVLTNTPQRMTPQKSMTLCQGLGSYCGSVRIIRPCAIVPFKNPTEATKACQPRTVNQPMSQTLVYELSSCHTKIMPLCDREGRGGALARNVTQEFLILQGRKHGNPVILSSRCWCPVGLSGIYFARILLGTTTTHIEHASASVMKTESVPIQTKM